MPEGQRSVPAIFLSYRRSDTAGHAGRLYDRLSDHYGRDRVFMDIDTIEPGADFVDVVDQAIGSSDVVLVLIGDEWVKRDLDGGRRIDDPDDLVRIEVEKALERRARVIPVLVEDSQMPSAGELPPTLRPLTRRNAVGLSNVRWAPDVEHLTEAIDRALTQLQGSNAASAPHSPRPTAGSASASPRRSWLGPWNRSKSLLLGGVIVAVALAGGLGAYFALQGGSGSPPPASTAEPKAAIQWTPIQNERLGGPGRQEASSATVGSDGSVVAVGVSESAAAAWRSPSGADGSFEELPVSAPGSDSESARDVSAAGPAFIAVGYGQISPSTGGKTMPVTWRPAPVTWRRTDVEPVDTGYQVMNAVAVDGDTIAGVGAVAAGRKTTRPHSPLPTDAAFWISTDGGQTWDRSILEPQGLGYQIVHDVIPFAGGFLAVGYDGTDQINQGDGAVWRYEAGAWEAVPGTTDLGGDGDQEMDAVTEWEGGLVAVGCSPCHPDADAAVWTSQDGNAWTKVPDSGASFGGAGGQRLWGVTAGTFGIVAVGCAPCDADADVAVWASENGVDWARADDGLTGKAGAQVAQGVTSSDEGLVMVGWEESHGDHDAAVWIAPLGSD